MLRTAYKYKLYAMYIRASTGGECLYVILRTRHRVRLHFGVCATRCRSEVAWRFYFAAMRPTASYSCCVECCSCVVSSMACVIACVVVDRRRGVVVLCTRRV